MADVCIRNAAAVHEKFTGIVVPYYVNVDPEYILNRPIYLLDKWAKSAL